MTDPAVGGVLLAGSGIICHVGRNSARGTAARRFDQTRCMHGYAIIEAPSVLGLFPGGVERLVQVGADRPELVVPARDQLLHHHLAAPAELGRAAHAVHQLREAERTKHQSADTTPPGEYRDRS